MRINAVPASALPFRLTAIAAVLGLCWSPAVAGVDLEPACAPTQEHVQLPVASSATPSPTEGQDIALAPYWVDMGRHSAKLAWRSRSEHAETLSLTCLEDGLVSEFASTSAPQQLVHMRALRADTQYRWAIQSASQQNGERPVTYSGTFTTHPARDARHFAVLGHTHGKERLGHYSDDLLASCVARSRPHFLIHTGDCVYHSNLADWKEHFLQVFRPVLEFAPIYISPGNHDSGWPFIEGIDLRPFKTLFPHSYPRAQRSDPGSAYYDVIQGPVHLLMLSYVTDLRPGTAQHDWIRSTLRLSESPFRVVVLGGRNNYYDRGALHDLLSSEQVDAVFMGDGGAPAKIRSDPGGYPVFTLGSKGDNAHPWLDVQVTSEHLVLHEMNAMGLGGQTYWIHSKTRRKALVQLGQPVRTVENDGDISVRFSLPQPSSTDTIRGIQFEVSGITSKRVRYSAVVRTKSLSGKSDRIHSQFADLGANDTLATAAIPAERPVMGGPYEITSVSIRFTAVADDDEPIVTRAWLYGH